MSETPSTMLALGTTAADFSLPCPATGKQISWQDIKSDIATVVIFICNHCPYVLHIADKLAAVAAHYHKKGVNFVAINANDIVNYPADSPEKMPSFAEKYHFDFPYLFDESQQTAKDYHAACTPDFFVFDQEDKCAYRGRFDGATPGNNKPITGAELSAALDRIIAGEAVDTVQHPSLGCNIKWK